MRESKAPPVNRTARSGDPWMMLPPDASRRSSSVNTTEWYRRSGPVRLQARAPQCVRRDVAEGRHRGDGTEELRLRPLEHDDRDEARVVGREEARERRDVRV